ncbi:hypothetical protein [Sulfurospirillum barnesii]|uniref:Uncharacterized protein n=1 Tax=Sulfurospirillum barnesii (strain ATCC 700032 / DSM 10660 / SES-3) TaxID=760154 RepID=I3XV83_SULBS|nr:hypothetical protein [Sulfurospirillum barnesii]AFL67857.1 hypothetical protein Sulba_0548 [Sulfurospirillum barnesii SES-3]
MQFLLFIGIALFLSALWYANNEALSKRNKQILLVLIVLTIGSGGVYEWQNDKKSAHNREMANAFKQGKTLLCKDKEISNESFIFVSGTQSFIPNETNTNDKGVVIDIVTCKLK